MQNILWQHFVYIDIIVIECSIGSFMLFNIVICKFLMNYVYLFLSIIIGHKYL